MLHLIVGQDAFFDHEGQLGFIQELGQLFERSGMAPVSVLILDLSLPNLNQAILNGCFTSRTLFFKLNRPHDASVTHVG